MALLRWRASFCPVRLWLFFFLSLQGNLFAAEAKSDPRGPGTIRMAQRLRALAEQSQPMNNRFLSSERVEILRGRLAAATDPEQRNEISFSLASELLNASRNA